MALATSATGQAVGCADTAGGRVHPFRYQGGVLKDLHLPPGMTDGCAISVNASGTILGFAVSTRRIPTPATSGSGGPAPSRSCPR